MISKSRTDVYWSLKCLMLVNLCLERERDRDDTGGRKEPVWGGGGGRKGEFCFLCFSA